MIGFRNAALGTLSLLGVMCATVSAETVSVRHGDRVLTGNLQTASPGGLADGVVLLVHGTLAHHAMEIIATLQSLLAERGHSTLAVTLSLGVTARTGMYDCTTPHAHRHFDAVQEIGAWIDWLGQRGAGPVTLAGHSRGGNQVARYALKDPRRTHTLVLIAPSTFDPTRTAMDYEKRHAIALSGKLEDAAALPGDAWLEDVPFLHCGPSRVTAGAFLSYYGDDGLQDTPTLLPRLTMPTLVIAGSADRTVSDVTERTRPHLDGNTQLVLVQDADHFFRDLYAEDVADAVAVFIAQHR